MQKNIVCLVYVLVLSTFSGFGQFNKDLTGIHLQSNHQTKNFSIKDLPKYSMNKYGTLVGIQRGKYFNIELGVEQQRKQVKFSKPNTWAGNARFEYSWDNNSLGFKTGAWYKSGRMGFTFGGDLVGCSDFEKYNLGIAPAIGFKIIGFHAVASYNLLFFDKSFNYNTLHLSIRYFISRNRDLKRTN
jgi:hypothetical protein